jgi:hypothetical protein
MRRAAFVTVCTAATSNEAEFLAAILRRAGLHPADVPLVAPFPAEKGTAVFPVEVPNEEAAAAEQVLKSHSTSRQS